MEVEEKKRVEKVLSQLKKAGVNTATLPLRELQEGDGEHTQAHLHWAQKVGTRQNETK
jgi:hypothetical protein